MALFRADYLELPRVLSLPTLGISLLFLCGGFVGDVLAWRFITKNPERRLSFAFCLAGTGLSIFTKYVPGKVLVVLGRAAYTSERRGDPLIPLAGLSLNSQIISVWCGLMIGASALIQSEIGAEWVFLLVLIWLGLGLVIFLELPIALLGRLLGRLIPSFVSPGLLPRRRITKVAICYSVYWILHGIGFYFLAVSLHSGPLPLVLVAAFPLSATVGILALFFPGGLGVREAVITGILYSAGLELSEAAGISVASRIWFLAGESAFFLAGLFSDRRLRNQRNLSE